MRAKIITQVNAEHAEPGREPIAIGFNVVEKVIIEKGQFRIDYRVIEKAEVQRLELPVEQLFEVTLEFF